MKLSDRGAQLIANYEGFRATPYWDVNRYSIGYGTRARNAEDGPITREQALERMRAEVDEHFGAAVDAINSAHKLELNQNQFDALTSLAFNTGPGVLDRGTTLGAALRARDWDRAADAMLAYDRAGGEVLAGLTRRRQEERKLFLTRPAIKYSVEEREWLAALKNDKLSADRHDRVAGLLRAQALVIQKRARAEHDGWRRLDRGRRYQGIRRALRRYA